VGEYSDIFIFEEGEILQKPDAVSKRFSDTQT